MRSRIKLCAAIAALALVASLLTASASMAARAKRTCSGSSPTAPGILKGKFHGNVTVKGICAVMDGNAKVVGNITVKPGGSLVAIWAHNTKTGTGTSNLDVTGNITVDRGAAALLGCKASSSPCSDDTGSPPTLSNKITIGGDLIGNRALGIVVHSAKIHGNVTWVGGGGGTTCAPAGIFAVQSSPPFFDLEDSSVHGGVKVKHLDACWLGVLRVHIRKSFNLKDNYMGDPDAIEIGLNVIKGNLSCSGNTNVDPASLAVWDSAETTSSPTYPRASMPNTVMGKRSGQCVYATPDTQGGAYGPKNSF